MWVVGASWLTTPVSGGRTVSQHSERAGIRMPFGFLEEPLAVVGEQCRFRASIQVEVAKVGDRLKRIRRIAPDQRRYINHPLHEIVRQMRPGLRLDAHSKALLRLEPSMPLVAEYQDSTYFARPGALLVQMAHENRVRRSFVIPDSLFRVPEDRYVFSAAVTLDFILGRLAEYADRSSRLVGVYALEIEGQSKIAAIVSHDYLKTEKPGWPDIAIAIFSPGLIFEDLIRLPMAAFEIQSPVAMTFGKNGLYWQSSSGRAVDVLLGPAVDPSCIPLTYVPVL